ncbi:hypothetical protein E5Q_03971 [Mixia osmundae IAM 14324]|uniref:Kinetochore protein NDC80 n=1 Tax=Mixia osmundae (strain CBS 9802 / IAM 14324 / JCM 22182 / KY 12970) TaxID=764103 RepID=G7E2U9_MIXOS|nr:hypothetical protein E5Q_03971 [Mixia osmundae IAM 14324]
MSRPSMAPPGDPTQKKQRMSSMAPPSAPQHASSSSYGAYAPPSVRRQSMAASGSMPNASAHRQSLAPSQPFHQPSGGKMRRSSIAPEGYGRASMSGAASPYHASVAGALGPNGLPLGLMGHPGGLQAFLNSGKPARDTRDLRSVQARRRIESDVYNFLQERNYEHMNKVSLKMLTGPTSRDFWDIFRFIWSIYDPSTLPSTPAAHFHTTHEWHKGMKTGSANGVKWEDEAVYIIKGSGYPFAEPFSKSHLQAPAAMHVWPMMLGLLDWIIKTIRGREAAFGGYPELVINPAHVDDLIAEARQSSGDTSNLAGGEDRSQHFVLLDRPQAKLEFWHEYLQRAYPLFLASDQYDLEPYKQQLESRFEAYMEQGRESIAVLTESIERLQTSEASELAAAPKVDKLQLESQQLKKDLEKMKQYRDDLSRKVDKFATEIVDKEAARAAAEEGERRSREEREELARQVASQGISEQEALDIFSEQEKLAEDKRQTEQRHAKASQDAYEAELAQTKLFVRAEKLIQDYTSKLTHLSLLPIPPEHLAHIDFRQELNGSASDANEIVPNCTTVIRPVLTKLRQDTIDQRLSFTTQTAALEPKTTAISEQLDQLADLNYRADAEYELLQRDLQDVKESTTSEMTKTLQAIESVQWQVNNLKHHIATGKLALEQKLQTLENEHANLIKDVETIKKTNESALQDRIIEILAAKEEAGQGVLKILASASEPVALA